MCTIKVRNEMFSIVQGASGPEPTILRNLFAWWWWRRWRWRRWRIISVWWCSVLSFFTITFWLWYVGVVGVLCVGAATVAGWCWCRLIWMVVIVMSWIARSRLVGGFIGWINVATGPWCTLWCRHCIWNIVNTDWMQIFNSRPECKLNLTKMDTKLQTTCNKNGYKNGEAQNKDYFRHVLCVSLVAVCSLHLNGVLVYCADWLKTNGFYRWQLARLTCCSCSISGRNVKSDRKIASSCGLVINW